VRLESCPSRLGKSAADLEPFICPFESLGLRPVLVRRRPVGRSHLVGLRPVLVRRKPPCGVVGPSGLVDERRNPRLSRLCIFPEEEGLRF